MSPQSHHSLSKAIIRSVWKSTALPGRCFCRRAKGAYREVLLVHHGRRFHPEDYDIEQSALFVEICRSKLQKAKQDPAAVLFQLDNPAGRERRYSFMGDDMARLLCVAHIATDRLPAEQWDAAQQAGNWRGVLYNGDRIEMWEKSVEQKGRLYLVREGGWTSNQPTASHFEEVTYIGTRRGAMLYAGYPG